MEYSFFRLTIPILQRELGFENKDIIRIVSCTLQISSDINVDWSWFHQDYYFTCVFRSFNWTDYEVSIVKDFISLFIKYDEFQRGPKPLMFKNETTVFNHIDINNINKETIPIHDSAYLLSILGLDMPCKFTHELIYEFVEVCSERLDYSFADIYKILFKDYGKIHKEYKDNSEISPDVIRDKCDDEFLIVSFLVAYVKANNLYTISDKFLLEYLNPYYIIAFREFWWKCEIWGKNKDDIQKHIKDRDFDIESNIFEDLLTYYDIDFVSSYSKYDRMFSIGTDFSEKLYEFETTADVLGIDIKMKEDYLKIPFEIDESYELVLNAGFAKSIGILNVDNDQTLPKDEANVEKILYPYLNYKIDKEKIDVIFLTLKKMIGKEGCKGKKLAAIILGAVKAGIFYQHIVFKDLKSLGFKNIGTPEGYNKIMRRSRIHDEYKYDFEEIEGYCKDFLEIKDKIIIE